MLKPSTRQLIHKNHQRSARLWHDSVGRQRTLRGALDENVARRRAMAAKLRRIRKG